MPRGTDWGTAGEVAVGAGDGVAVIVGDGVGEVVALGSDLVGFGS